MFDSNAYGDDIVRKVDTSYKNFIPMKGEVLIELVEERSASKIILPTGFKNTNDTIHAKCLMIGDGCKDVKYNDLVIAERHYALKLDFTDKTCYKVPEKNILMILEN